MQLGNLLFLVQCHALMDSHAHACAQNWSSELFGALKDAGGIAYSNYAVGFNNVVVPEATSRGITVGNTPGAVGGVGRVGEEHNHWAGLVCIPGRLNALRDTMSNSQILSKSAAIHFWVVLIVPRDAAAGQ
eukprot:scaffold7384_cov22-Tisochrysis_lutea.AAC.1